jgi:hypothetical protein
MTGKLPFGTALYTKNENVCAYYASSQLWENNGILGRYNPQNVTLARTELEGKQWKKSLESLVGFCRAHIVLSGEMSNFFGRAKHSALSAKLKPILESKINHVKCHVAADISAEIAEDLSLFSSFQIPWKSCLGTLRSCISTGPFSYSYSLEETLVILHMHPEIMPWVKLGKDYEKDKEFYIKCVAAAIAEVLVKKGGTFNFNLNASLGSEQLFDENVKNIVSEYIRSVLKSD